MAEFAAAYYQSGNYADYLSRGPRYTQLAKDLASKLHGNILDFGCGVGFLTRGLQQQGLQVRGYDASKWAILYGRYTLKIPRLTGNPDILQSRYNSIIGLDVLEHISVDDLHKLFEVLQTEQLVVRIPVAADYGSDFVLDVSRNDVTHITCWTKSQWHEFFRQYDYQLQELLQLPTIWDSPGVLSCIYRHREYHAEGTTEAQPNTAHP